MKLLRILIAEKLLNWALAIMPEGTEESIDLALFLNAYCTKKLHTMKG